MFYFCSYKNNLIAKLVGKYDFSSYSGSGDIEDSVSGKKAVFSTGDAPIWDSGELKFITGKEYIQLADFELKYDEFPIYATSSVTINIWIKIEVAPALGSNAYIFRCQLEGETVRI